MNFALPPANDWRYIAELTGDDSWAPEEMQQHFIDLERSQHFPPGTPGHGFDGYISVRLVTWFAAAIVSQAIYDDQLLNPTVLPPEE